MATLQFQAPKSAETYISQVKDRSYQLISSGIWHGIEIQKLKVWMNNFKSLDEKYFAACILDSLLYRSSDQTDALLEQLFLRCIPELFVSLPPPINIDFDWLKLVSKSQFMSLDPGIRIVAVIKKDDPPTKSASFIARLIKRIYGVDEKWIIVPNDIPKLVKQGIKIFIFVDDFLGTGEQFGNIFLHYEFNKFSSEVYFLYAPLVAHEKGIQHLTHKFPNLKVTCAERLYIHHSIFDINSTCFNDKINSIGYARSFYNHLLKSRGLMVKPRRGFGHLGLAYAFSHAVPDNCLPILYLNKRNWQPLFDR